jgi:hypothetical protein
VSIAGSDTAQISPASLIAVKTSFAIVR